MIVFPVDFLNLDGIKVALICARVLSGGRRESALRDAGKVGSLKPESVELYVGGFCIEIY